MEVSLDLASSSPIISIRHIKDRNIIDNLVQNLDDEMALAGTGDLIERATEQTIRWSPSEHHNLTSDPEVGPGHPFLHPIQETFDKMSERPERAPPCPSCKSVPNAE